MNVHDVETGAQVTQRGDRDVLWGVSQLEVEYQRFSAALNHRVLAPAGMPLEELQLRYDLFVSRVGPLDAKEAQALFRDPKLLDDARAAISLFVHDADQSFGPDVKTAPSPARLVDLQKKLADLRDLIRDLRLPGVQPAF